MLATLLTLPQIPPAVFESLVTTAYLDASPFGYNWGYVTDYYGNPRGSATNQSYSGNILFHTMDYYNLWDFCRIVFYDLDDSSFSDLGFTKIEIDGIEYPLTWNAPYNGYTFANGLNLFSVSKQYSVKVYNT